MSQNKKRYNKFISSLFFVLAIFAFSFLRTSEANATGNVYGWAWTEDVGWISFNDMGLTSTGAESAAPTGLAIPAGINSSDPHYGIHYGVNIEASGSELSGYAWSENIGWITFNLIELADCPTTPCNAKYHPGNGQVTGWARACSVFVSGCSGTLNSNRGAWDGWIELHDITIDSAPDPIGGWYEFHNWVWGGSDDSADTNNTKAVIGWGTFNCYEGGPTGGSICGTGTGQSNYKVVTTFSVAINGSCGTADGVAVSSAPTANLCSVNYTTPIVVSGNGPWTWTCTGSGTGHTDDNCSAPLSNSPPTAIILPKIDYYCSDSLLFQWTYYDADGDNETKFDFQVDDNSNFSSPVIDKRICGTNIPNPNNQPIDVDFSYPASSKRTYCSGADQYTTPVATPNALIYDKTYHWRVRVWDTSNNNSGWVTGPNFTTAAHAYPYVSFTPPTGASFSLINGFATVNFTDTSTCYAVNNAPAACASYNWNFGDGNYSTKEDASHSYSFVSTGLGYPVTLNVCGDNGCCPATNYIQVKNPLTVPTWKEISPF